EPPDENAGKVTTLPRPHGRDGPTGTTNGRTAELDMGTLDGDVAAVLEQAPGTDGMGHKLSQLLLGFLATEVVPLAERLAELGIDPTPLFTTASGILRLYAHTLERPRHPGGPREAEPPRPGPWEPRPPRHRPRQHRNRAAAPGGRVTAPPSP